VWTSSRHAPRPVSLASRLGAERTGSWDGAPSFRGDEPVDNVSLAASKASGALDAFSSAGRWPADKLSLELETRCSAASSGKSILFGLEGGGPQWRRA
jgi:hypothetical protein